MYMYIYLCMFVYDTQKYFRRHYFELLIVVNLHNDHLTPLLKGSTTLIMVHWGELPTQEPLGNTAVTQGIKNAYRPQGINWLSRETEIGFQDG